jgi:hypothetical protein
MVPTANYNGNYTTSPFQFRPFDIQRHHVEVNGMRYPTVEREMNFTTGQIVWAFYEQMRNLGYAFNNASCGLTLEEFADNHTIFVFDMTANAKNDTCFELMKKGTTSYHARFRAAIPAGGVTMIIRGDFDSIIKVDNNRQVTNDLTIGC